jgi:hypothetical protein
MLRLFAAMLLALVSLSAAADWQYTKWGMSQKDVVKASKNTAIPDRESAGHSTSLAESLLTAPYRAGRYEFTAYFLFESRTLTLSGVSLRLVRVEDCDLLRGELASKYGKPQEVQRVVGVLEGASWRDEPSNNGISIAKIGTDGCSVQYWALRGASNKEL